MKTDLKERIDNMIKSANDLYVVISDEKSPLYNQVERNTRYSRRLDELRKIRASIMQYADRDRTLRYVGFLGNFSSGKSSTVNNLLELKSHGGNRMTDLHPTDDRITNLTHPDNRSNLIGGYGDGLVRSEINYVDVEMLKNFVVIDTPGTGDPSILNQIIQDFLPLCDLIVYVFTSTQALNESDLPILKLVSSNLPFIPTKFVITRSDEFRKDRYKELSEENIDKDAQAEFLKKLVYRIGMHVPKMGIKEDDIVCIDNLTGYGIDRLRSEVFNPKNYNNEIHEDKIDFFDRALSKNRDYYLNFTIEQLDSIQEILDKAEVNHGKYTENMKISVSDFESFLNARGLDIERRERQIMSDIDGWLTSLSQPRLSKPFDESFMAYRADELVEEASTQIFDAIYQGLQRIVTDLYPRNKAEIDKWIKAGGEQVPSCLSSILNSKNVEFYQVVDDTEVREMEQAITDAVGDIVDKIIANLRQEYDDINSVLDKLQGRLKQQTKITLEQEYFENTDSNIREIVSSYIEDMMIYKNSIMAMDIRELSERVSLSKLLDDIGRDHITDQDRNAFVRRIRDAIFVDRDSIISAAQKTDSAIANKLTEFNKVFLRESSAFDSRASKIPNEIDIPLTDTLEKVGSGFVGSLYARFKEKVKALTEKAKNAPKVANEKYIRHVSHTTWINGTRWIATAVVGGVLGWFTATILLGIQLTTVSGQPPVSSWNMTGILSYIVVLALFMGASWWGLKQFFKRSASLNRSLSWFVDKEKSAVLNEFAAPWREVIEVSKTQRGTIEMEIADHLRSLIMNNAKDYGAFIDKHHQLLTDVRQTLTELAENYEQTTEDFFSKLKNWFEADEEKSTLMLSIADEIKNEAIEPSLLLFRQRRDQIALVRDAISKVDWEVAAAKPQKPKQKAKTQQRPQQPQQTVQKRAAGE